MVSGGKVVEDGVYEGSSAEADHVGDGESGFVFSELEGIASFIVVEAGSDQGQAEDFTAALGSNPTDGLFVHGDHAVEGWQEALFVAFDGGRARAMGKDQRVRYRAVEEAECHGRVAGVVERALAFYEDPFVLVGSIEHDFLDHARGEIADQAIDGETIIGDHNAGLAGGEEGAIESAFARFTIQFEGRSHFASGAIAANEQDGVTARAMWGEVGDALFFWGTTHIPDGHVMAGGGGADFLIIREKDVQAADDIETGLDGGEQLPAPGFREIAAARRDADEQRIGLVGEGRADIGHDRNALTEWSAERVGHVLTGGHAIDNGNGRILAIANHAGGGFGVVPAERSFS